MLLLDDFLSLNGSDAFRDTFFVVIQLGAVLAVTKLFWQKMTPLEKRNGRFVPKRTSLLLWAKTALACLPGAAAVFLLRDVEDRLESPGVIAAALIGYGVVFLLLDGERSPRITGVENIRFRDAFRVGLFQVLSLVPGTSRSGSTIVGGLAIGMERQTAAEFSFFLAVPVMAGYSLVKLLQNGVFITPSEWACLAAGCAAAHFTSLAVVRRLMGYLKHHGFRAFGWYRIGLGVLVLIRLWSRS